MVKDELYISIDVETDGPIPGANSLLSLGAAAFVPGSGRTFGDGSVEDLVDTFGINLAPLPGAAPDPRTEAWWSSQPQAWQAATVNAVEPSSAIGLFRAWVERVATERARKPACAAWPAGFDFTFVYWYLIRFGGHSPFGFQCIDLKTMAMTLQRKPFRATNKKGLPQSWKPGTRHTHVAVDDAVEQGQILMAMLRAR